MKRVIIYLSIILIFVLSMGFLYLYIKKINNKTINKELVTLEKCVDGDTAWFKSNSKIKKYRFLSIDTPEVDDEFGLLVINYTCDKLNSAKKIEIEYDELGKTNDKYNRELVWIYLDDNLLQEELVSLGYAKIKYVYASYDKLEKLYDSESLAKNKNLGIWYNYKEESSNKYYKVILDYIYKKEVINILENDHIKIIENPKKQGCKFIGWKYKNNMFDLSKKIKRDYTLVASFDC